MRYVIWAAVSSEQQAKADKVSLDEQVAHCRAVGEARGWTEASEPYIVPGQSRTKYVNLSDAEKEIPQLAAMLDAAKAGQFDLLMLYDMNRLRDLIAPVEKTLGAYKVQIYSVSQPVEPQDPAAFSPYTSDASSMMSGMAQILSRAQIADLRRKYAYAMPRRTQRGLPAQVPYGYNRTDRKSPPVQNTEEVAAIYKMRDLLYQGKSLTSIANELAADGVPPPHGKRWYHQTCRMILANPFYAGVVRWGASQQHNDPRTGKVRRDRKPPASHIVTGQGQHVPLWDMPTHEHIVSLLKARGTRYEGKRSNQLSGLLYCGECGARMWVFYRYAHHDFSEIVWQCSSRIPGHPRVPHPTALEMVGEELRREVQDAPLDAPIVERESAALGDLQSRRGRVLAAYEAGVMPLSDYALRIGELDAEIKKAMSGEADMARLRYEAAQRREALVSLKEDADYLPSWITEVDPLEVNTVLRLLLARIVLHEDSVELEFS